jgi:hypothetical protein
LLTTFWLWTWWKKPEYPERTTDHGQATGKLYHLQLRVECTLFVIYKAGRECDFNKMHFWNNLSGIRESKKDIRLLYPGCYKLMFYDTDHKKTFIFWISCCFFLNKHSRRIHVLVICLLYAKVYLMVLYKTKTYQ